MVKLGQEVKDRVTGFKGIAVVMMEFLNGCRRVEVQPKIGKDGSIPDGRTFDEPDLEFVSRGILPEEKKQPVHGDPSFRALRVGH